MKPTHLFLAAAIAAIWTIPSAQARSGYKSTFNGIYGTGGSRIDVCELCHGSSKSIRNPYGQDVEAALAGLPIYDAILDVETNDSDGDGVNNIAEIFEFTFPGDALDFPTACVDGDGDGFIDASCGGDDCDDTNFDVNPGETELTCDGLDNDCDAATEDTPDNDGDGESVCDDCDDNAAWNFWSNAEDCMDAVDNNCDGLIDSADPECAQTCTDADGDLYFAESGCGTAIDCDDFDSFINPGIIELECDGIDNNCNGMADEDLSDDDGDGESACVDCDDNADWNFWGNTEDCADLYDNDCDGLIDGDDPDCAPAPLCSEIASKSVCNNDLSCAWVGSPKNGQCEDSSSSCTIEEVTELSCGDGVDNDCDGAIDCADSDCDCPPADCTAYGDRSSCNGDAQCRWSGKNKVCNQA